MNLRLLFLHIALPPDTLAPNFKTGHKAPCKRGKTLRDLSMKTNAAHLLSQSVGLSTVLRQKIKKKSFPERRNTVSITNERNTELRFVLFILKFLFADDLSETD